MYYASRYPNEASSRGSDTCRSTEGGNGDAKNAQGGDKQKKKEETGMGKRTGVEMGDTTRAWTGK